MCKIISESKNMKRKGVKCGIKRGKGKRVRKEVKIRVLRKDEEKVLWKKARVLRREVQNNIRVNNR